MSQRLAKQQFYLNKNLASIYQKIMITQQSDRSSTRRETMKSYQALGVLLAALGLIGCGLGQSGAKLVAGGDLAALGSGLRAIAPDLPEAEGERAAVLLSYLPIDDRLEGHIPFYLNALERTTSERIYNLALTDGYQVGDTWALRLSKDASERVVSPRARVRPGVEELTTNKAETLAETLAWAYTRYPGRFKAFSYLGHGGGYMGIATDAHPATGEVAPQMMGLSDFGRGMRAGLKGRKLDWVHLHACLMANVEAAVELEGVAEVLTASEDVVGAHQTGTEKPTEILNTILQGERLDARSMGREMVIQLNPKADPYGYATAVAVDLSQMNRLKSTINQLAQRVIEAMPERSPAIVRAFATVPEFKHAEGTGQRDLWTLCKNLMQVGDPAVTKAAEAVIQAQKAAMLHSRDGEGRSANGLSILMQPSLAYAPTYKQCRFARETVWLKMLRAISAARPTQPGGRPGSAI
jgi:hypothetical protein